MEIKILIVMKEYLVIEGSHGTERWSVHVHVVTSNSPEISYLVAEEGETRTISRLADSTHRHGL